MMPNISLPESNRSTRHDTESARADAPHPEALALVEVVRELAQTASAIDTRRYEDAPPAAIRDELVTATSDLLATALALFSRVSEHYEPRGADDDELDIELGHGFERNVDQLMSTERAAQRIADISFIARMELAQTRQRLVELAPRADAWEHIDVCASVRQGALKSASALERAICEHEGVPITGQWYVTERKHAITIRRAYAIFRRELGPDDPPDDATIYARMRGAGTALAKLIGRDAYEQMRIRDRRMLREAQDGVLRWLRGERDERDSGDGASPARAGQRRWQDVVGVANLLMEINNRSVLVESDARVLPALWDALFGAGALTRPSAAALELARELHGLDIELDECIARGAKEPLYAWRPVLARLLDRRCPGWRESDADATRSGDTVGGRAAGDANEADAEPWPGERRTAPSPRPHDFHAR